MIACKRYIIALVHLLIRFNDAWNDSPVAWNANVSLNSELAASSPDTAARSYMHVANWISFGGKGRRDGPSDTANIDIANKRRQDEAILASLSRASRANFLTELQINAANIQTIVLLK